MKKLTIYQMAKKAGVSIATISRAMNSSTRRKVSPATLAKIDALIEKHGYTPNLAAQNLSRASSKAIGVLVPQTEGLFLDDYYARILSGVSDALLESEYQFKLVMLKPDRHNWDQYNFKFGEGVDGLVVPHWPFFFSNKSFVKKLKIPTAIINDWDDNLACHRVGCDNEQGGEMMAQHLLEQGHRRVAVLAGPKWSTDSVQRLKGFKQGLKKEKINLGASDIVSANYQEEEAADKVSALIQENKKITALFCLNDAMALGALRGLEQKGIACPDQISVVGFDNSTLSGKMVPQLTTIHHPIYEMARGATQILLGDMERHQKGRKTFVEQLFPVHLVQRASVAKLN